MTDLVDADDATRAVPTEHAAAWPTPTGPPVGATRSEAPSPATPPVEPASSGSAGLSTHAASPHDPTTHGASDATPKLTVATGPGAIFSGAFAGDEPARPAPSVPAPSIPSVPAPSIPAAAAPAPAAAGRAYADFLASGAHEVPTRRSGSRSRGRAGRWFSRLVVLGVLGGIAAAGVVWGPDLYERWRGEDVVAEPAAPLTFPAASEVLLPIRTATFVIDGPDPSAPGDGAPAVDAGTDPTAPADPTGEAAGGSDVTSEAAPGTTGDAAAPRTSYTVTIDFESTASRIVIDRGALPDLEVLTAFDDAVVRRVDRDVWYRMPRGELPVTEPSDRLHWVRSLDELFPPEVRQRVSIADASVSDVAGVPTRRLRVRFDPSLLDGQTLGDPTAIDPTDGIAGAAAGVPPTSGAPASTTPSATSGRTVELEIWVDDAGLVRRATGDLLRGAAAVTVLETSDQSWLPAYPDPSQLRPLTAAALIELGL